MTLAQTIKLRTNDGFTIVEFLIDVMQDRYKDFRICHRLQAAKLLTTYGNEDAPDFIDDNPRDPKSDRNGRRPRHQSKFDEELARVIREDTSDGRSVARFLVYVMEGELASFRPHHRMSAARELLDRGFGKSARAEKVARPEPVEGPKPVPTIHPEPVEGPNPSTDDTNQIREIPKSDESQFRHDLPYLHPDDFDETVHEFLENIGHVPNHHLEYIGDEVMDGLIDLDPLGLDRIHFRAKLSIDPIDELEIRDFSGGLDRPGVATGLFITTSDFTDVARRSAETISTEKKPIRLVDGSELARFMASLDMGVTPDIPIHPRKLDEDHHTNHI